jgi:hypothetical protein
MGRHLPPTRAAIIHLTRRHGVRVVFGPAWRKTQAETLRELEAMTDAEYLQRATGCDHHDEHGRCLGHDGETLR